MAWQPLNVFQRLTLQWDQFHPYNGGQVMRLTHRLAPDHAADAWSRTLQDLGMGQVELLGRHFRHSPADPASSPEMRFAGSDDDLDQLIQQEMNRQFELPRERAYVPFRPLVATGARGTALGLIYHHWVADSVSIRLLMRQWFYRCCHPEMRSPCAMEHLGRERMAGPMVWLRAGAELLQWGVRAKRARRIAAGAGEDMQVHFRRFNLPDGAVHRLRAAASRREVKLGDLLIHALAEAVQRSLPAQRHRPDIAIGTIRDTRALERVPDYGRFGMRLGFANLICPAACLDDRERLLAGIAAEHRRHRLPAAGAAKRMEMRVALGLGRFLDRRQLLEFYRKRLPLSAGVSNVDLSQSWVAQHHPRDISEFFRISPTGPALPLVIAPTTLGQQFGVTVTWRCSAITDEQAATFIDQFSDCLLSWADSDRVRPRPAAPARPILNGLSSLS